MFERFTDQAKKAMALAYHAARDQDDKVVDEEHILIGLVKARGGAYALIERLEVSPTRLLQDFEGSLHPGSHEFRSNQIPFTEAAKSCLETALRITVDLQRPGIDTSILLLALTELRTKSAETLERHGVTAQAVRAALEDPPLESSPPPSLGA
ncbi:MAG: Clp protease N-terminal domain-containing protein [Planctomycetota bacterium]